MKKLYRYEIEYKNSEEPNVAIRLKEIPIKRETEKCYFIVVYPQKEKRILKDAFNTYAYDNKEKAMEHFKRRTNTRIGWYHYWSENCEVAVKLAEKMKPNDTYIRDDDDEIFNAII